jgi:glycosyltransferase involved in cell wall biosynthesis
MIGIYAPYNYSETTYAAISLAEHAAQMGLNPVYLACDSPHGSRIHPYWDPQVLRNASKSAMKWLRNCDTVVWFQLDVARLLASAKLGKRNILVLGYDNATRELHKHLDRFHTVVCPSRYWARACSEHYGKDLFRSIGWATAAKPVPKQNLVSADGRIHLHTPLDKDAARSFGNKIICALEYLLSGHSNIWLTVSKAGSWPREVMAAWTNLEKRFGLRSVLDNRRSFLDRMSRYINNDWTLYPACRTDFGLTAIESLGCGTPVISFDIPPLSEVVANGANGCLLPCGVGYDKLDLPRLADPSVHELIEGLEEVVPNLAQLRRVLRCDDQREVRRQKSFSRSWRRLLSVA